MLIFLPSQSFTFQSYVALGCTKAFGLSYSNLSSFPSSFSPMVYVMLPKSFSIIITPNYTGIHPYFFLALLFFVFYSFIFKLHSLPAVDLGQVLGFFISKTGVIVVIYCVAVQFNKAIQVKPLP